MSALHCLLVVVDNGSVKNPAVESKLAALRVIQERSVIVAKVRILSQSHNKDIKLDDEEKGVYEMQSNVVTQLYVCLLMCFACGQSD